MSYLYFNEESDYSEENTVTMKSFSPPFSTYSRFSCRFITCSIRVGNLDWCKCGYSKNEAREINFHCCREVDVILIASTKIPERQGSISPSSFYGHMPDYQ